MARRSNDKATRSPIEGLCYVARDGVAPGDSIPHSRLIGVREREEFRYETDERYVRCTVITAAECGDYSGNGLVGESNYRTLKKEFPWLVEIYGSHGYKSLAYLGKRENQSDALIEAIDSLCDYPIYSDDDHSDLEHERMFETWDADGAKDFADELSDILDELDPGHEHEPRDCDRDLLSSIWHDGCDAYGVNGGSGYANEQGDSIYFYTSEWVSAYNRNPERVHTYSADHAHETFRERLTTLAHTCRVVRDVDPAVLLVARDAYLTDPNGEHFVRILNTQINPAYHAAILTDLQRAAKEQTV